MDPLDIIGRSRWTVRDRALYGPSVPSQFQTRPADGQDGRDFIGKRTESKTILYGTYTSFRLLTVSRSATGVTSVTSGALSR